MGDHKHKKSWQKDTLATLPGQPAEKKSVAEAPGMENFLADASETFKIKQGTLNRQTNLLLTESLTNPRWSMVNPALQKRAGGPGNFGLQKREYLVEGAELTCSQGSCNGKLKIPEGHHYLSGDRKKANCRDCVEGGNIPYFGNCSLRGKEGGCEGFMLLDEQWRNTERPFHGFEVEYVDGEPAIITSSVLLCKRGGIIRPVTSGQGYDGRLNYGMYKRRYKKGLSWAAGQKPGRHRYEKDPINMNTGNYIYEREDLVTGGKVPLSFRFLYNAMECGEQGNLGEGWCHNYGIRLKKTEGDKKIEVILEDGSVIPYRRNPGGAWLPELGDPEELRSTEDGYVHEQEQRTCVFDREGKLIRQEEAGGARTFRYNEEGLLEYAENGLGAFLRYTYNEEKHLIQVEDHTGRKINFRYQYGKLRWFINSGGHTCTYEYNFSGRLESVRTPRGITGVKNTYDGVNRVLKQAFPDGSIVEFRYDDEKQLTYMREQNGRLVTFESDDRMRSIRIATKDGEETFAYNDQNRKIRHTDRNGYTTAYAYDSRGNLSRIVYPDGTRYHMTHDTAGRLLTLSVNGIQKQKNVYDAKGRPVEITDALGRCRRMEYDPDGNLTRIRLPDKNTVLLEYDGRGNVSAITDGAGRRSLYEYDECSRITRVTDGNGNRTCFTWNEDNQITSVTDAAGNRRTCEYGLSGKIQKAVDFDGAVFRQEYNCMNQAESLTLPDGNMIHMEYDAMQNLSRKIYPNGAVFSYAYNRQNLPEQITLPTGGTIRFQYDRNGNRTEAVDPEGNRTVMEYDSRNRMVKKTDPVGAVTAYAYDPEGRCTQVTDAAGNHHTYEYDAAGQLVRETDVRGNTTVYEYDSMGRITGVTDPAGRRTVHTYDAGGKPEKIIYPDGTHETYRYDPAGNLILRTNHRGDRQEYTYDCLNRPVSVKNSFGQEQSCTYDAVGRVTSVTDALGRTTCYEYSPAGNLMSVLDAAGNRTEYAYDLMGNLSTVCRHEGTDNLLDSEGQITVPESYQGALPRITRYLFGLSGKPETVINPLGMQEQYEYDRSGRMTAKTDADGYTTRYAWNPVGDLRRITYADGRTAEFTYNSLRQLVRIDDWLGTTRIEPDAVGYVKKITDPMGREVSYEWGALGERRKTVYPDGQSVSFEYDGLSRLVRLKDGKQEVRYCYDADGRLIEKQYPDEIRTGYQYSPMGRLKSLTHQKSGTVLEQYEYEYDLMGNRTELQKDRRASVFASVTERLAREECGNYSYRYDSLDRLTEVLKDGKLQSRYRYDAYGNRTEKETGEGTTHYSYNEADQLVREEGPDGERTFQYDRRGNLTAIRQGEELLQQYLYDETSRMAAASDGIHSSWYQYSGAGNRTGILEYTADPLSPGNSFLPEAVPAGVPSKRTEYVTDLTRPYHNLLQKVETAEGKENLQSYTWDTNAVFLREGECVSAYLQDELGSPVRLTGLRSGRQTLYGYDEFGADLFGNQGETQPFGYTGYQPDRTAGTSYAQAREYLPWAGRFAGKDLVKGFAELPFTLNEYGYCWNNPLILVDRNGALPEWINKDNLKKIAAGAITIIAGAAIVVGLFTSITVAGVGLTVIGAGTIIGAVSGGTANEITGGEYVNGYIGGGINAAIAIMTAGALTPYGSNAMGGFVGNYITEILNNYDLPENQRKDIKLIETDSYIAAGAQALTAGGLDHLSNLVKLNGVECKGWDRVAGIYWDSTKMVYSIGVGSAVGEGVGLLTSSSTY